MEGSITLNKDCTLQLLSDKHSVHSFNCGDEEINNFLKEDALNYIKEMIGKTYVFTLNKDSSKIVCYFTVSNDSLRVDITDARIRNRINRNISNIKRRDYYPAVLIGRLGVNKKYKVSGGTEPIGTQLMNFIKFWFSEEKNKTGCRFIVVDSFNSPKALNYYQKSNFQFLFDTEENEKLYRQIKSNEQLNTRFMFFDLMTCK